MSYAEAQQKKHSLDISLIRTIIPVHLTLQYVLSILVQCIEVDLQSCGLLGTSFSVVDFLGILKFCRTLDGHFTTKSIDENTISYKEPQ